MGFINPVSTLTGGDHTYRVDLIPPFWIYRKVRDDGRMLEGNLLCFYLVTCSNVLPHVLTDITVDSLSLIKIESLQMFVTDGVYSFKVIFEPRCAENCPSKSSVVYTTKQSYIRKPVNLSFQDRPKYTENGGLKKETVTSHYTFSATHTRPVLRLNYHSAVNCP